MWNSQDGFNLSAHELDEQVEICEGFVLYLYLDA